MNIDGSGQINLTNHPAPEGEPSWQSSASGGFGTINGTVYESFSGVMRGATVTLQPLGLQTTTSISDGTFSFSGVPYGNYSLVVTNPGCTPFGCYKPQAVTHGSPKTSVSIFPNPFTPTPTPTPMAVGGFAELPGGDGGSAGGASWLFVAGALAGSLTLLSIAGRRRLRPRR